MSYATQMIRSGRTFDYDGPNDVSRENRRLRGTWAILEALGAKDEQDYGHRDDAYTVTQFDGRTYDYKGCPRHPDNLRRVSFGHQDRVGCTCGADRKTAALPEWLTDEMIDKAWALVDTMQEARGAFNRRSLVS